MFATALAKAVGLPTIFVGVEFACPLFEVGGFRPRPVRYGGLLLGDGCLTLGPRRALFGLGLLTLGFELSVPGQLPMLAGFDPAVFQPLFSAATRCDHGHDNHAPRRPPASAYSNIAYLSRVVGLTRVRSGRCLTLALLSVLMFATHADARRHCP